MKNTLGKKERLNEKLWIDKIFREGKLSHQYPITMSYMVEENGSSTLSKVLISVPKKRFKNAVHRNMLKRRIRESYRLNKSILSSFKNKKFYIVFIYSSNNQEDLDCIFKSISSLLSSIKD